MLNPFKVISQAIKNIYGHFREMNAYTAKLVKEEQRHKENERLRDPKEFAKAIAKTSKDGDDDYFARMYSGNLPGLIVEQKTSRELRLKQEEERSNCVSSSLGIYYDPADDNKIITNYIMPNCPYGCGNAPCGCYAEYKKWKVGAEISPYHAKIFQRYEEKNGEQICN